MKLRTPAIISTVLVLGIPATALGDDDHGRGPRLQADPFVFVGKAGECGEVAGRPWPAGSNIVTSAWLGGMGLPDNGGGNTLVTEVPSYGPPELNPPSNANRRDPHLGLLLSKNGPTFDCSAAGAEIKGFRRGSTITELGFDFRKGGHCGAGAPRFNLTSEDGFTYFAGCSSGVHTGAPKDPGQWERVRFGDASVFPASPAAPPFVFGVTRVDSIAIVYDEGTDTANNDTDGVGLAVLDNIDVSGRLITRGSEPEPKRGERDHDDD
jgi:hypothetical protein